MQRSKPNIAITGTPGTGKSTLAARLAQCAEGSLKVVELGNEGEERGCREEYDEKLQSWVIDEYKLAKAMVPEIKNGGYILDWMHADFWSRDCLLDLVVTLRDTQDFYLAGAEIHFTLQTCANTALANAASTATLYDRYEKRGYSTRKVEENLDAEIFGAIAEENRECFQDEIPLMEMNNDTEQEMQQNLEKLEAWINNWYESHSHADARARRKPQEQLEDNGGKP